MEFTDGILLCIPPDESAHLVRAALFCKPCRRHILNCRGFLRHYGRFHRPPPLRTDSDLMTSRLGGAGADAEDQKAGAWASQLQRWSRSAS
ncbi:hypothetical protein C2845_PM03G19290 [Panicum miliaceum]|uniref:Uncharacterized protein n=1 Tax=Panicum miliaceum TaxID=4540 RepID=A0A3L6T419_PANMI|nr:hypothetical protein C2845_PM03G19290 [Panicum miliaceum]